MLQPKTVTEVTKNSLKLLDLLKALGVIKFDSDFGNRIGLPSQNLHYVKLGHRNMPKTKTLEIIKAFHLNPAFLTNSEMPVFDPKGDYSEYNALINTNSYLLDILIKDWSNLSDIQVPRAAVLPESKDETIAKLRAAVKEKDIIIQNQQKLITYMERELAELARK